MRFMTRAGIDIFACTHTCLPLFRLIGSGVVVNNGAAASYRRRIVEGPDYELQQATLPAQPTESPV